MRKTFCLKKDLKLLRQPIIISLISRELHNKKLSSKWYAAQFHKT